MGRKYQTNSDKDARILIHLIEQHVLVFIRYSVRRDAHIILRHALEVTDAQADGALTGKVKTRPDLVSDIKTSDLVDGYMRMP